MTKISQYTPITSLVNGDLIDTSQDSGGGIYATKSIDFQDLQSSIFYNRTENGVIIQEVRTATDLPSVLIANTIYVIMGIVSTSTNITVSSDNCAIIGLDRDIDGLTFNGTGDFITVTDVNFQLSNLKLSSTNSTGGEVILRANNFNYGTYNDGRNKVLTIINCQFRNCYDVHHIEGFDLVDIQNTLFWYSQATTMGCHFKNNSKLQITSCEYVRWFDETSIPTPSGYATTPLIELLADGLGNGFGAVNISGCVIHPQQTQDGINISNTATIGFGTIASNTLVNIGLTTGLPSNIDYDIQNSTIIQANQGIQNGNALATMNLSNNLVLLDNSVTNPIIFKGANTVGGVGFTSATTFPLSTRVTTSIPDCSLTYNSKVTANFIVIVNAFVERSGDGFIVIRLRNNTTPITTTIGRTEIRQGRAEALAFSVIGQAIFGDVFDIEIECQDTGGVPTGTDVLIRDLTLNGYQF